MSRGLVTATIATVAMVLAVLTPGASAGGEEERRPGPAPDRPNIVVILTDDERVGLTDAMPILRSRVKRQGTTFTNAMVPTALCCPSRASLLTGKFAPGTGVWGNGVAADPPLSGGQEAFVANGNEAQTLAVALGGAGYRTVLVGKYLNGYTESEPRPPGWDVFEPFLPNPGYYEYRLGGVSHGVEPEDYSTDVLAQRAVDLISGTPAEKPLLLLVAPFGPHFPMTPAPRHVGADVAALLKDEDLGAGNEPDIIDKPEWVQDRGRVASSRMRRVALEQHRVMLSIDELVGRLLDELEAQARMDNTLVVYTSDNGYLWGEHRVVGKGVPYARSTEVPLFMRWDGRVEPGASDARVTLNVDVTATIADAAGVAMPWSEGRSVLQPGARRGFVLESIARTTRLPHPADCGWRKTGQLFVRYATGEEELSRYRRDPLELTNLADRRRQRPLVRTLRAKTKAACVPTPPGFSWRPSG